jgi:2-oxoglutarate ferredoxin oxidoreductase subunit alpha
MANFGTGYHIYITGLTHKESGYPSTDSQADHHQLVLRLCNKIRDNVGKIVKVQRDYQDAGDSRTVGIISYGVTSRSVFQAVKELRQRSVAVDHLRIITNWPFPEADVAELVARCRRIVVPELNLGQMYHLVREVSSRANDLVPLWKTGGELHTPQEIIEGVTG